MADAYKKRPLITSPVAAFRFPKLKEPDMGTKDYPKPDGEYSVQFLMKADDPTTKGFMKTLDALHKEALAEAEVSFKELKAESRKKLGSIKPNSYFTEVLDKETEEPTGEVRFKAAMAASGVVKKGPRMGKAWTRKPVIYDAKGVRIANVPDIWGGTTGRVAFEVNNYFIPATGAAGISLKLAGVQIIDLVAGGERTAGELGFGEEDGYSHDSAMYSQDAGSHDANEASDF